MGYPITSIKCAIGQGRARPGPALATPLPPNNSPYPTPMGTCSPCSSLVALQGTKVSEEHLYLTDIWTRGRRVVLSTFNIYYRALRCITWKRISEKFLVLEAALKYDCHASKQKKLAKKIPPYSQSWVLWGSNGPWYHPSCVWETPVIQLGGFKALNRCLHSVSKFKKKVFIFLIRTNWCISELGVKFPWLHISQYGLR